MKLLFPSHPIKKRLPDPDYEPEVNAARQAGFDCEFFDLEVLRDGDAMRSCKGIAPSERNGTKILYRGWMMSDLLYAQLHSEMVHKGYAPFINPEAYAEAHYLPNSYPHITGLTPETASMIGQDLDEAWALYQRFIEGPALVKDFVKSAKHLWNEACFIPARSSRTRFGEIINAFLKARGSDFNKGIVLRRFHDLATLENQNHGQPIHEEYRMFFWRGTLLAATPPLRGDGPFDEMEKWSAVARRFKNHFISMDVARQTDNLWIIVEVGDGGVSGLPPEISPEAFYGELWKRSRPGPPITPLKAEH